MEKEYSHPGIRGTSRGEKKKVTKERGEQKAPKKNQVSREGDYSWPQRETGVLTLILERERFKERKGQLLLEKEGRSQKVEGNNPGRISRYGHLFSDCTGGNSSVSWFIARLADSKLKGEIEKVDKEKTL